MAPECNRRGAGTDSARSELSDPGTDMRALIMNKAATKTYTVRTRNSEYRAAKSTLEDALRVAREKVWRAEPDKKVRIYRGDELVGKIEPWR